MCWTYAAKKWVGVCVSKVTKSNGCNSGRQKKRLRAKATTTIPRNSDTKKITVVVVRHIKANDRKKFIAKTTQKKQKKNPEWERESKMVKYLKLFSFFSLLQPLSLSVACSLCYFTISHHEHDAASDFTLHLHTHTSHYSHLM